MKALFLVIMLLEVMGCWCWLDPSEISALHDIRNCLQDLPGSNFFATWNFNLDPCIGGFGGVVCWSVGGVNHVTMLSLGSGLAGCPGLSGTLSPSLGRLTFLRALTVAPGQVRGSIPESLGFLSEIQFIGISKNRLSGTIPESFANLCSLQGLDLSYNALEGNIPSSIGRLPNLNTLTLSHNRLKGNIPAFSSPLIHLDLQQNELSGSLPSLPSTLEYLSLSKNCLTGFVQELSSLQRLAFLDLSFNQFCGSIPSEIFSFKLSNLLLQRNQFSGTIQLPPSLPVSISMVDLSYNLLTGQPPGTLAFAAKLFLNNNKFSGAVPQEFVDGMVFGDLQVLYLQHNYITNINMASNVPLPTSCTFCIQYNCMSPPSQSSCPLNVGKQSSRPMNQCSSFH